MRIGNVIIDIDNMNVEDIDLVLKELKRTRARKVSALAFKGNFQSLLENMRDQGFTFCSKHTGEVLKADEWVIYDDQNQVVHD